MPSALVMENSYMFPHGTRSAHSPRRTTPMSNNAVASQVTDMPMFAARRPACGCGRSRRATSPAGTVTGAAVRFPENATANATMATVSAAMLA